MLKPIVPYLAGNMSIRGGCHSLSVGTLEGDAKAQRSLQLFLKLPSKWYIKEGKKHVLQKLG